MGYALKNEETYTEMCCGQCGIIFYVPEYWRAEKQRTGKGWSCPNGHSRVYTETTESKLRKELAEKEQALSWERQRAETMNRRLKQEAGKHRALKDRIKAGVCPCCKRTVRQLAEHMKTKHPDYNGDTAKIVGNDPVEPTKEPR